MRRWAFRWDLLRRRVKTKKLYTVGDFNWGGDDPKEWYPFEWHFMAVIVEKGKAFSGWDNYLNAPPIPTPAAP